MKAIVDRYRAADWEERLHLFLSHRELRRLFMGVELEGGGRLSQTPQPTPSTVERDHG